MFLWSLLFDLFLFDMFLSAELEENSRSVKRLMSCLHRVMNELNTFVLTPLRSPNLIRDDFSALVMDIQVLCMRFINVSILNSLMI